MIVIIQTRKVWKTRTVNDKPGWDWEYMDYLRDLTEYI